LNLNDYPALTASVFHGTTRMVFFLFGEKLEGQKGVIVFDSNVIVG